MSGVRDMFLTSRPIEGSRVLSRATRIIVVGALTALMIGLAVGPAQAYTRSERLVQLSFTLTTVGMPYEQFLVRKADFERARCRQDKNYSYSECTRRKPSPMNGFDWSDDGCSGRDQIAFLSLYYRDLFNKPCQLHDFGYRNFGQGLALSRTEDTRRMIDDRFYTEMRRVCQQAFPATLAGSRNDRGRDGCLDKAASVYYAVRLVNTWR